MLRRHCYHPDFRGSFKLKDVLPVLVPALSYEGLEISGGMEAIVAYYRLISGELSDAQHATLTSELEAYCEQDTRAMYEIYWTLKRMAADRGRRGREEGP